jgi:uncharacterized Zn finger protein
VTVEVAAGEGDGGEELAGAETDHQPLDGALHDFWRTGAELDLDSNVSHAAEVSDALLRQLGQIGLEVRGTEVTTVLAQAYRLLTTAAEKRALSGRKADPDE